MPKKTYGDGKDQNRSNWGLSFNAQASYLTETKQRFQVPDLEGSRKLQAEHSDPYESQVRLGDGRSKAHMESVNTTFFNPGSTALASTFVKQGPAPGFDRLTANKPQWELGMGTIEPYKTRTHAEHGDPAGKSIGKQAHFHSIERRMFDATTSMRKNRHDLGYDFDLITGTTRPESRLPVGPKFCQSTDIDASGDQLGIGDGGDTYYHLTQGRVRKKVRRGSCLFWLCFALLGFSCLVVAWGVKASNNTSPAL